MEQERGNMRGEKGNNKEVEFDHMTKCEGVFVRRESPGRLIFRFSFQNCTSTSRGKNERKK